MSEIKMSKSPIISSGSSCRKFLQYSSLAAGTRILATFQQPQSGGNGLLHGGCVDSFFLPEQVDALEARLKEGDVNYEFYHYGTEHAFANQNNASYDTDATQQA